MLLAKGYIFTNEFILGKKNDRGGGGNDELAVRYTFGAAWAYQSVNFWVQGPFFRKSSLDPLV